MFKWILSDYLFIVSSHFVAKNKFSMEGELSSILRKLQLPTLHSTTDLYILMFVFRQIQLPI